MLLFLLTVEIIALCDSQWTTMNYPLLPQPVRAMACGSYNDSIYILGGEIAGPSAYHYITEYKIVDNIMVNHATPILPVKTSGFGQFYTQIDNILYMIDPVGDTLSIYNMKTNVFTTNWLNEIIPINVYFRGCLASSDKYLFITGGWNSHSKYLNTVQIFDLEQLIWINNIPSMQHTRVNHACIVVSDALYVIGGGYGVMIFRDSIETININNIQTQEWMFLDSLTQPTYFLRCIARNNIIWIIGGGYYNVTTETVVYRDTVHIIDTMDDSVSLLPERLPYGLTAGPATIIVNDTIYVFGGTNSINGWTDNWIKYVPTLSPTNTPTIMPTSYSPTASPSSYPTYKPSNNPTATPTSNPNTNKPSTSYSPTTSPTNYPTYKPSNNPTATPTSNPNTNKATTPNPTTSGPTIPPTKYPSNIPTATPTSNPNTNKATTSNPTTSGPTIPPTKYPSNNPTVTVTTNLSTYTATTIYQSNVSTVNLTTNKPTGNMLTRTVNPTSNLNNTNKEESIIRLNETNISMVDIIMVSTTSVNVKYKNDNELTYVLIGIGCALFACVLVICMICIYKMNKLDVTHPNQANKPKLQLFNVRSFSIELRKNGHSDYADHLEKHDDTVGMKLSISSIVTPRGIAEEMNRRNDRINMDKDKLKKWLKDTVKLGQYYDNFIENGYESLAFIKEIVDKEDLKEIGIVLIGHQTKIMAAIKDLRNEETGNVEREGIDDHESHEGQTETKK